MSKHNPTNPGSEFLVIYPTEGGAWGGHYATPEVAFSVVCSRLGWDADAARLAEVKEKKPREWLVLHETLKRSEAPRIVEVL